MTCLRYALTALAMLIAAVSASAQDVIVLKDGSTVLSKVTEITPTDVRFKKFNNLDGPTYTYSLTDIIAINYENGQKENFDVTPAVAQQSDIMSTTDRFTTSTSESDIELLRNYMNYMNTDDRIKKVKKYRLIGWIGGGTIILASILPKVIASAADSSNADYPEHYIAMGIGIPLGAAWTAGWVIAANKIDKEIKQFTCVPIYEHNLWENSAQRLTAGADIINCNINNRTTLGIGLGLRYTF